ncbi:hypothetical protein L6164_017072 [Bauhinia variegata]|uniref:Uncharacterized protein n=1 Tax=Bauhinia variegata TaxID=167791 RepID=A0ACB9N6Y1_BAUVA|nr:hypothetical protein L6164_017072 [Bauhinia variegata]
MRKRREATTSLTVATLAFSQGISHPRLAIIPPIKSLYSSFVPAQNGEDPRPVQRDSIIPIRWYRQRTEAEV